MSNAINNKIPGTPLRRFARRLRIVLVIPMVIVEAAALLVAVLLAVIHKPTALRWIEFCVRILPNKEWYYAAKI